MKKVKAVAITLPAFLVPGAVLGESGKKWSNEIKSDSDSEFNLTSDSEAI